MVSTGTVRQEIEARNRALSEAFRCGQMAAVAAVYTEDAIVLPPDSEAVRGRAAIAQFFATLRTTQDLQALALQTEAVEVSGEMAYEVGTETRTLAPVEDLVPTDTVKYVVVWKRSGGGPWQRAVAIWNSTSPAPVPE